MVDQIKISHMRLYARSRSAALRMLAKMSNVGDDTYKSSIEDIQCCLFKIVCQRQYFDYLVCK